MRTLEHGVLGFVKLVREIEFSVRVIELAETGLGGALVAAGVCYFLYEG